MQGRNPYQGQAVSNMDFPTAAYVQAHGQAYGRLGDAYAQAAAMEAQGKQQMVEGLGKGLMGAFGEFKANREAEKNFSAGKSMLESPYFRKMLGMQPDEASDFGSYLDTIKKEHGTGTANRMMESALNNIMKYAQGVQDFERQKKLIDLRTQGAINVARLRASSKEEVPWKSASSKDIFPDESDDSSNFDPTDLGFGNNPAPTFRSTKNPGVR